MEEQKRTFFLTSVTFDREHLFHTPRYASLLLDVLLFYRDEHRYAPARIRVYARTHPFDSDTNSKELRRTRDAVHQGWIFLSCAQRLAISIEVWQPSFSPHRIEDAEDYRIHVNYVHQNPVRARLVVSPQDYEFSSARKSVRLDAPPEYLRG